MTCLFVTASSFWDLRMSRSQTGSERVVGRSNGGRAERPRSEFMASTSSANKIWMNYVWSCFYVTTIVTICFFLIFYWFLGIGQWCCDGGVVPLFFFFLCHNNNSTWTLLKFAHKLFSEFFWLLGHAHEYNLLVMSFAITSFFVSLLQWVAFDSIQRNRVYFHHSLYFFYSPFRLLFYHFGTCVFL